MADEPKPDWNVWLRESAAMMTTRSRELMDRHGLKGAKYTWDLDSGTFTSGGTKLALCVVGTVENGTFMWSWANGAIPPAAKQGIERVRDFGLIQDIPLLCEPAASGGLGVGKLCLAVSGRILDAASVWMDEVEQGYILFVLHEPALIPQ